ncbi:hypothetical protein [Acinetobacter phage HFM1]|nr:hypothetical protein [Acinetobacter phage HFM1]
MKPQNQFRKENVNINFVAKNGSKPAEALKFLNDGGLPKNTAIKEALVHYAESLGFVFNGDK